MNANELADELNKYKGIATRDAATMLRQQQAEIEALKLQLHTTLTNRDLRTYDGKTEINNEPLAWMVAEMVFDTEEAAIAIGKTYDDAIIPLYTHPVKELTDEEIDNISDEIPHYIDTYMGRRMFARAILIKAQEK
jgi:hypothetical protein